MRYMVGLGLLCALNSTVLAELELYATAETFEGERQVIKIDPTDATSIEVVSTVSQSGLSWLGFNPATNTLMSHDDKQIYNIDLQTGEATPFEFATGLLGNRQVQGVDYVPGLGIIVAYGVRTQQDNIGLIQENGLLTGLYSYGFGPAIDSDFDELVWDSYRDQLYVISSQSRELFIIDEDTGAKTDTTFPVGSGSILRATVNPTNGLIYEVGSDGSTTSIYQRDPITGLRVASLGTVPGYSSIQGLAFVPEPHSVLGLLMAGLVLIHRRTE